MQEKKKQYILDDLLRIILAMFVLTVLFAFSCLLLSHGARGIWLAVLAQFTLLGVLGGVFLRRCLRIVQKNEQVMQLYAAGYTIADICHLKCYFSRGTEMALKKAVALLDTGKLLSVSKRQAQYLALQNQINPHFLYNTLEGIRSEAVAGGLNVVADSSYSLLALIGQWIAPLFAPLGFADWRCATALISGFVAKESVVSTLEVLLGGAAVTGMFSPRAAISFLVFTLLYTPCVAAIATIRRELGSTVKTVGVVILQCGVAWLVGWLAYAITGLF